MSESLFSSLSDEGGKLLTSCIFVFATVLVYHAVQLVQSRSKTEKNKKLLRRQMTPIGTFAMLSQTEKNPSISSFFIALASKEKEGMGIEQFEDLFSHVLKDHPRFRFRVNRADKCFEEGDNAIDDFVLKLPHPDSPQEFKERVESFLTSPIDVTDKPWEVSVSTGPIGTSGAIINSDELREQGYQTETVALFRVHHVVCDGVSIAAVVKDVCDEKVRVTLLLSGLYRSASMFDLCVY